MAIDIQCGTQRLTNNTPQVLLQPAAGKSLTIQALTISHGGDTPTTYTVQLRVGGAVVLEVQDTIDPNPNPGATVALTPLYGQVLKDSDSADLQVQIADAQGSGQVGMMATAIERDQ